MLFGIAGLIAGSYLYAELSEWLKKTVETWGECGKIVIPDLLRMPRLAFAYATAGLLAVGIFVLERTFPR